MVAQPQSSDVRLENSPPISPIELADLMLAAPILDKRINATSMEPHGNHHLLTLRRGRTAARAFLVDDDVAVTVAVRVAAAAALDPLPSIGATGNNSRLKLRAGDRVGELIVTLAATSDGFYVDVQSLNPHQDLVARSIDDPRPGGTIGVYRVGAELGSGGMGSVYAATHAFLERPAAIKLMHQKVARDSVAERQFLMEARLASKLRHRGIVSVLDFGVLDDGRPYMVMERVDGESLHDSIGRTGSLPVIDSLRIAEAIADALCAAHEHGIVHNDLKPANAILTPTGVKLVDFGAASIAGAVPEHELIIGTLSYMSPERFTGLTGDTRSDLYALGIVLYEMLTGTPPIVSEDISEVARIHREEAEVPMPMTTEPLPRAVVDILKRALRKKPNERYQTATEMKVDLSRAIQLAQRPAWRRWLP